MSTIIYRPSDIRQCFLICILMLAQCHSQESLVECEEDGVFSRSNFTSNLMNEEMLPNATTSKTDPPATTTSPDPPLVERIEIRLVQSENTSQETPLIIVDVVKKNGSSGVTATIQQQHKVERIDDTEQNRPKQAFLVRLHQPNYHAVAYVPFDETTFTTMKAPEGTESGKDHLITSSLITTTEKIQSASNDQREDVTINGQKVISAVITPTEELEQIMQIFPTVNQQKEDTEILKKGETYHEDNVIFGLLQEEVTDSELIGFGDYQEERGDANISPTSSPNSPIYEKKKNENVELENNDLMVKEAKMVLIEQDDEIKKREGLNFSAIQDLQVEHIIEEDVNIEGEECIANRKQLPEEVVKRLQWEQRRIVQSIKRINKHQMVLCRPDKSQGQIPYRKCPMWRREKFFLYYALMKITYCGNHAKWPGRRRL